jgi:site-specific recombinase XerD
VSTEFIQESLGHTSMKTTESYLDSFEKSLKKEYSQKLVAFKDDRSLSDDVHEL